MSFLTAEWRKLAMANYEVPAEILQPYVPYGTELDRWQGRCYASLIGFMFKNTRLKGVKVPFHVNFEEVNLRIYVKREVEGEERRGVVFIKEIVPKPAISLVANVLYNEKYHTTFMRHNWQQQGERWDIDYEWKWGGQWHKIAVNAEAKPQPILPGTEAEFITEHYWGYAHKGPNQTTEYEVTHPRWQQYAVQSYNIQADFEKIYGPQFAFLNQAEPLSVFLVEGSAITIEGRRQLKK